MGKQQSEQIARAYMQLHGESFETLSRRTVGASVRKLAEALRRIGTRLTPASASSGQPVNRSRRS
jgi:hypothetical protein